MKIAVYETNSFNRIEGLNEKEIGVVSDDGTGDGNTGGGGDGSTGGGGDGSTGGGGDGSTGGGSGVIRILTNLEELGIQGSGPGGSPEPGWEFRVLYLGAATSTTMVTELVMTETEFFNAGEYIDITSFVETNGVGVYIPTLLYPDFGSGSSLGNYESANFWRAKLYIKPLAEVIGSIEYWTAPGLIAIGMDDVELSTGILVNDINSQVDLKFTENDESTNVNWT